MELQDVEWLVKDGQDLSFIQALDVAKKTPVAELVDCANRIRTEIHGDNFDLCSIVNAKSGHCSENCKFCAQSGFYSTAIQEYPLVNRDHTLKLALHNEAHGVGRFSLVSSGRTPRSQELTAYRDLYGALKEKTGLHFCASMGMLTPEKAEFLVSCGVSRYHCNLEACRTYFPQVCTSHTWEEKIATLKIARTAGMSICSGGIIGMGESLEHRIMLACELRDLQVMSIPLNVLHPIANTPLEHIVPLSVEEIIQAVALFRLINPKAVIRLAGGRGLMKDEQYRCFKAGANGAIVGDYLTTEGASLAEDLENIRQCGFSLKASPYEYAS